ncbi:MAG TPA: ATP-binding protein [Nitrospirota bacterium]|nr:ATP-binding protein [Nitrospirota bacterium]
MADSKQRGPDVVSLTVPSHPKFLYVVRSAAYPVVIEAGFSRKEARRIVLALDEACSNIIRHAYEGDPEGKISLTLTVTGTELLIELRDTGKQVDITKIAPRDLKDIRPGGLGTHFINAVFDTVRYDTSGREGTLLTLQKKRPCA